MELPIDEEHNEQMMRVPEPLEVCPPAFFHCKVHHDPQRHGHDPPGGSGARDELREDERRDSLASRLRIGVGDGELGVVNHMRSDVDKGEEDDRPGDHLVEGNVLVKGDDVVQCGSAQQGDKVPADGEQDENDIDMQDESSRASDGYQA